MLGSILSTAVQGLQVNQLNLEQHATQISRYGTEAPAAESSVNLEQELVGVMTSRRGFEANLAVVRTADEMLGTLIDVLA